MHRAADQMRKHRQPVIDMQPTGRLRTRNRLDPLGPQKQQKASRPRDSPGRPARAVVFTSFPFDCLVISYTVVFIGIIAGFDDPARPKARHFITLLKSLMESAQKFSSRFQHLSTPFLPLKPISSASPHPTNYQKSTVTNLLRQPASPKPCSADDLEPS